MVQSCMRFRIKSDRDALARLLSSIVGLSALGHFVLRFFIFRLYAFATCKTLDSPQTLPFPHKCRCGAHSQHRLFKFRFENPSASLKEASAALHLRYANVRRIASRLNRKDLSRYCPECFRPTLLNNHCESCGFEAERVGVDFEGKPSTPGTSLTVVTPTNLGSLCDYSALGLGYGSRNIAHIVERPTDAFMTKCVTRLRNELERMRVPEIRIAEATSLTIKEIKQFRYRYPLLVRSKVLCDQFVQNSIKLYELRFGPKTHGWPRQNS